MDRDYVAYVLDDLLEQFDACHQQTADSSTPLSEPALAALTQFRTTLELKIEDIATNPTARGAVDYYGHVAARWIRRYAPSLTPQNVDVNQLVLAIEELIMTLETRHRDDDRWGDARSLVYEDQWLWDTHILQAVSDMVSYTLPGLIA